MQSAPENWDLASISDCIEEVKQVLVSRSASHRANEKLDVPKAVVPVGSLSICSKCPGFRYITTEEFRDHCRSDWHVCNLKRSQASPLSFEEWSRLEDEEEESESASDDDAEYDDPSPSCKLLLNGMPFTCIEGTGLAVPVVIADPAILLGASYVCVLLLRSGRFAGAVWDGFGNVITHTSFKRYTVRRKAGGSQSKSDNAKGSPANSVGAQIRRAQERKLSEDVGAVITSTWRKYFDDPKSVVFMHASVTQMDDLLVGPLARGKQRCRIFPIPISLRDPTFSEVCRAHRLMTQVAFLRVNSP